MCYVEPPKRVINGVTFIVVVGTVTTTEPVYTYEEALAYTKGHTIATSN